MPEFRTGMQATFNIQTIKNQFIIKFEMAFVNCFNLSCK